jgi:hypothetical protein
MLFSYRWVARLRYSAPSPVVCRDGGNEKKSLIITEIRNIIVR